MKTWRYASFLLLLSALLLISIHSCTDNPITSNREYNWYPLALGNTWEYSRIAAIVNVRPDTAHYPAQDTSFYTAKVWVSSLDTLSNSQIAFLVNKSLECENCAYGRIDYYNNLEDGLYHFAYEGTITLPPFSTASGGEMNYRGLRFNTLLDFLLFLENLSYPDATSPDELILLDPPRKEIQYPLFPGASWSYVVDPDIPFTISKKVAGLQRITVPAGEFSTYVVQWL